jgi:ribosome modulation factor
VTSGEAAEDSDEAARRRGEAAGRERRPLSANPYRMGTRQRLAWEEGWREGEGLGPSGTGARA